MQRRIAFVIDNPNYHGGAHVATYALIDRLRQDGHEVEIISPVIPLSGIRKFVRGVVTHLNIGWYPDWTLDPDHTMRDKLATFDTVCCLGEPSVCRKIVSNLSKKVRKVMIVHTDYVVWSQFTKEARVTTRFDRWWYKRFDRIAVVGSPNAERLKRYMPAIADKVVPFHNLLSLKQHPHSTEKNAIPRILTLMRYGDPPKKTDRYFTVVQYLKANDVMFDWWCFGDSDQIEYYRQMAKDMYVDDCFHVEGHTSRVAEELCKSDLMVLLSAYEGLPNTIYESFMCGTPVFCTNVGAIADQVEEGKNGWLVADNTDEICKRLLDTLKDVTLIENVKNNLSSYHYDNEEAYKEYDKILIE